MLSAATPTFNEKQGSGRYRPLRKRKNKKSQEEIDNEFNYLSATDSRMRFNNSRDPIYFAFEYLDNRSLPQLMNDFIQDSFFEITNFVSKVIK